MRFRFHCESFCSSWLWMSINRKKVERRDNMNRKHFLMFCSFLSLKSACEGCAWEELKLTDRMTDSPSCLAVWSLSSLEFERQLITVILYHVQEWWHNMIFFNEQPHNTIIWHGMALTSNCQNYATQFINTQCLIIKIWNIKYSIKYFCSWAKMVALFQTLQ